MHLGVEDVYLGCRIGSRAACSCHRHSRWQPSLQCHSGSWPLPCTVGPSYIMLEGGSYGLYVSLRLFPHACITFHFVCSGSSSCDSLLFAMTAPRGIELEHDNMLWRESQKRRKGVGEFLGLLRYREERGADEKGREDATLRWSP